MEGKKVEIQVDSKLEEGVKEMFGFGKEEFS